MVLDGDLVQEGDTLFDVLLGHGRVSHIGENSCRVDFSGRFVNYYENGLFAGAKRLFWRDPVLFIPRRDNTADWEFCKVLLEDVLNYVETNK